MRTVFIRVAGVAVAAVVVASCDARLPTATRIASVPASQLPPSKPVVTIDSPTVGTLVNLADSVYVRVQLHDTHGLSNLLIQGLTVKGDSNLGTFATTARYTPATVTFRPALTDTVIRRYLQPVNPADTTLDSLVVLAIATDSAGLSDTARVRINLVSGPKVTILTPTAGDSVPAGVGVSVNVQATQGIGVGIVNITVVGQSTWPTPLDTTISQSYTGAPASVQFTAAALIPANAPIGGRVTITATANDVDRQPGSAAPIVVFVRSANSAFPRVTQTVLTKSEISDSVLVTATGQGIVALGIVVRDSANNLVERDSVLLPAPFTSNAQRNVPLGLSIQQQGRRLSVSAFAVDQAGRTGYAVTATQLTPASSLANAVADSTLIAHGRTFQLLRSGTVGDIAVDATRGNVFLSNTQYNRLEVWQNPAKTFDPVGIAVGSLPWGLAQSIASDTLLVANSGGTNISRVYIGSSTVSADREDLAHRILTRNTYVFTATEAKDQTTGQVHLTATGPVTYSNRPQYIAQSTTGHIYYSTEPTSTAPAGTIRWLDPSLPVPDPRQIWQYGTRTTGTDITYALFNVDSVAIGPSDPNTTASDTIFVWDHPYGQASGVIAVHDTTVEGVVAQLVAKGSDVEAVLRLDVTTLALEDTTFVQPSGSHNWIAFGEGNSTGHAGRVMMAADSSGVFPNSFSPVVTIQSVLNNASDQVFGLAVDMNGKAVGARGAFANFVSGQDPFHLQLQGQYQPLSAGSGITMHPQADGGTTSNATSLAFVASATGVIEVVDLAHYINRGTLILKYPVYGPIRASLPMPGDSPTVILKLFAMSTQGLIVIDVTAADILPPP